MSLNPAQIDKVSEELRSFLRVEVRSKKLKKLEPSFYKNVTAALETLKAEADGYLGKTDIGNYIKIKDRMDDIERDFKSLFQRRFDKIATLSIYDLDSEVMSALTPEEKEFIVNLHNMMRDQYNLLLSKNNPPEEAPEPSKVREPTVPVQQHEEIQQEAPPKEDEKQDFILVRILADQPPIAQPERDYYLHDNDLVYLPEKFAELLIKRKSAIKINLN